MGRIASNASRFSVLEMYGDSGRRACEWLFSAEVVDAQEGE